MDKFDHYLIRKLGVVAWWAAACLLLAGGCSSTGQQLPHISGTSYFVDCEQGDDTNSGTTPAEAWGSTEKVNDTTFSPGDGIFFKRNTTCPSSLWPKGSGREGQPIIIGAYGKGPLPIIAAGTTEQALKLFNQEFWEISSLETSGGTRYGILVSGDSGRIMRHIHLQDLVVHDVTGEELTSKLSGLVVVASQQGIFEDVLIDGVTAYHTNQWGGIIFAGPWEGEPPSQFITIRNSTVHNVYGDGIVIWGARHGLIETSVAYDTGQQPPPQTVGTPSSIWTWSCHDCVVQMNESYRAKSPDVDGGCYDIDWGTRNNLYQYNYGHDSDGYCLSFFGAGGLTTTNAIARYNVCANNARDPGLALRQGEIYFSTWNNGSLDGIQIYNNTIYANPARNSPVLVNQANFKGTQPNIFANNLVYSTAPWLIESKKALKLDHNLYWYDGDEPPVWLYGQEAYQGFSAYQQGSGQDAHGLYANPRLTLADEPAGVWLPVAFQLRKDSPAIDAGIDRGNMGGRDFFGNPIPAGSGFDIGAHEYSGENQASWPVPELTLASLQGDQLNLAELQGQTVLLAFLEPDNIARQSGHNDSRSQAVFLRSMARQFAAQGLRVLIVFTGNGSGGQSLERKDLINMIYDWQLQEIPILLDGPEMDVSRAFRVVQAPATFLITPAGQVTHRWDGLALAPQLAYALQRAAGRQTISIHPY